MANQRNPPGTAWKAWAAQQLGVDAGAAPDEVRAAFLRRAWEGSGIQDPADRAALLVLDGRCGDRMALLSVPAAEADLDRAVEAFAGRFFTLAPRERQEAWGRLRARAEGFVRATARLTALCPGLGTAVPDCDSDPALARLAAAVCELFVLRPLARSQRRQAVLEVDAAPPARAAWVAAANELRKRHRDLARLEPELLARLASEDQRLKLKERLNRKMRWAPEAPVQVAGAVVAALILVAVVALVGWAMDRQNSARATRGADSPPAAKSQPAASDRDPP